MSSLRLALKQSLEEVSGPLLGNSQPKKKKKRGPGRPPISSSKIHESSSSRSNISSGSGRRQRQPGDPPRKRGRPRKHPVPASAPESKSKHRQHYDEDDDDRDEENELHFRNDDDGDENEGTLEDEDGEEPEGSSSDENEFSDSNLMEDEEEEEDEAEEDDDENNEPDFDNDRESDHHSSIGENSAQSKPPSQPSALTSHEVPNHDEAEPTKKNAPTLKTVGSDLVSLEGGGDSADDDSQQSNKRTQKGLKKPKQHNAASKIQNPVFWKRKNNQAPTEAPTKKPDATAVSIVADKITDKPEQPRQPRPKSPKPLSKTKSFEVTAVVSEEKQTKPSSFSSAIVDGVPQKSDKAKSASSSLTTASGKARTVPAPSREIIDWIGSLTVKKQRRKICVGIRLKVRFSTKVKKRDGKVVAKLKWYGGLVTAVSTGGTKIRIKYDDGTSEVTKFPDKDIIVDDADNGRHDAPVDAFIPPPEHHNEEQSEEAEEVEGEEQEPRERTQEDTPGGLEGDLEAQQQHEDVVAIRERKKKKDKTKRSSSKDSAAPDAIDKNMAEERIEAEVPVEHLVPTPLRAENHHERPRMLSNTKLIDENKAQKSKESPPVKSDAQVGSKGVCAPTAKQKKHSVEMGKKSALTRHAGSSTKKSEGHNENNQILKDASRQPRTPAPTSADPALLQSKSSLSKSVPHVDEQGIRVGSAENERTQQKDAGKNAMLAPSADRNDKYSIVGKDAKHTAAAARSEIMHSENKDNEVQPSKSTEVAPVRRKKTKRQPKEATGSEDSGNPRKLSKVVLKKSGDANAENAPEGEVTVRKVPSLSSEGRSKTSDHSRTDGLISEEREWHNPKSQKIAKKQIPLSIVTTSSRGSGTIDRITEEGQNKGQKRKRESDGDDESGNSSKSSPRSSLSGASKSTTADPKDATIVVANDANDGNGDDEGGSTGEENQVLSGTAPSVSKANALERKARWKNKRRKETSDTLHSAEQCTTPNPQDKGEPGDGSNAPRSGRRAAQQANERISSKQELVIEEKFTKPKKGRGEHKLMHKKRIREDEFVEPQEEDEDGLSWVRCDLCSKWRVLPDDIDMDKLPLHWYCEMSTDPDHNTCEAAEQTAQEVAKARRKAKRKLVRRARMEASAFAIQTIQEQEDCDGNETRASKEETSLSKDPRRVVEKVSSKPKRSSPVGVQSDESCGQSDSGSDSRQGATKKSSCKFKTQEQDEPGVLALEKSKGKPGRKRKVIKGSTIKESVKEKNGKTASDGDADNQEWVQCEKCEKWRRLPSHVSADELPEVWFCSLNTWDPATATCDAEEDKADPTHREFTIMGGAPGTSKLSYRNLIFGTGRKQNRPASERMRAAESLFASIPDETAPEGSYPTVGYAKSSVYAPRSKGQDEKKGQTPFLDVMNKSLLWAELRGGPSRLLHSPNCIASAEEFHSFPKPSLPLDLGEVKQMICYAMGERCLAANEVLLEVQCRPWDGVSQAWLDLRALCSAEVVNAAILELVKEGKVKVVASPDGDEVASGVTQFSKFRRVVPSPVPSCHSTPEFKAVPHTRCMKIAKPWKRAHAILAPPGATPVSSVQASL